MRRKCVCVCPSCPIHLSRSTQVVEQSLSPEWEETFEFAVKEHSRRLDVAVLDHDIVVDEVIGGFGIKLEDLLHKRRVS